MLLTKTDQLLESLNPKESEPEVVARLQGMIEKSVEHDVWRNFRVEGSLDYSYWESDQWTAQEKAELRDREQPDTVRNEIKPIVERMIGQLGNLYQTIGFVGRNVPDETEGHLISDLIRWSDQQNETEFEESDVIQDMVVGGFGVMEIDITHDVDGEPAIKESYQDGFTDIYPDPFFRGYDWNKGARWVIKAPWVHILDAIALFPAQADKLRLCLNTTPGFGDQFSNAGFATTHINELHNLFVDAGHERLRLAEVWYKRKARRFSFLDNTTGKIIPTSVPLDRRAANDIVKRLDGFSLQEQIIDEMWVGVLCGDVLIHHDRTPHQHNLFKWVPYWAWRKKNGEPYGFVRPLRPINEAINKRESKALNMLSNRRIVIEEGAVDDLVEMQEQNARADGVMQVRDGALTQKKVHFLDNADVGQPQIALLESSLRAMESVSNQSGNAMGLSNEMRSGVGAKAQQSVGNLSVSPLLKNLRRSRRISATLKVELVKQYFDNDMVIQITDDAEVTRIVTVQASQLESIRSRKFNLIMVDTTDAVTTNAEELQKMLNLLPQLATLGPAWVIMGLKLSNLRNKKALIDHVEQISKMPPATPKMNLTIAYSDLSPEERAVIWNTMEQPELAKHMLEARPQSALVQTLLAKIADTKVKEGTRAMLERGRVDQRAAEVAASGIQDARKLDQEALIATAQQEEQAAAREQQAATPSTGGTA